MPSSEDILYTNYQNSEFVELGLDKLLDLIFIILYRAIIKDFLLNHTK